MATKDRVFIDKENLVYAAEAAKRHLLPIDRLEQFFIFMSLGFKEGRKVNVASGNQRQEMFLTHHRLTSLNDKHSLIYALALYDKNRIYFDAKKRGIDCDEKFVNLEDEKEMYSIAEKYANGGAYYFRELELNSSLDEKNLLEKEIKKYVRKINKE